MSKKLPCVTVTVDLERVKNLCEAIASYNNGLGLETPEGYLPDELDKMMEILVAGKSMQELRSLLCRIITLHKEAHREFLSKE